MKSLLFIFILLVFQTNSFVENSNSCSTEKHSATLNAAAFQFKIMTWNIWGRLNEEPRYTLNGKTARSRMIEILTESGADIITMTETYGSAAAIAKALNYLYYTPAPSANLTIFSRYPI